jgi:hypothetical protein
MLLMIIAGIVLPVFAAAYPLIPVVGLAVGTHEYEAPVTFEVSVTAEVDVPAHIPCVAKDGVTLATG